MKKLLSIFLIWCLLCGVSQAGVNYQFSATRLTATFSSIVPTNNSTINLASINLPIGDWECNGFSEVLMTGTSTWAASVIWLNTISVTLPAAGLYNQVTFTGSSTNPTFGQNTPPLQVVSNGSTTVYISTLQIYTAGTQAASGSVSCRKMG